VSFEGGGARGLVVKRDQPAVFRPNRTARIGPETAPPSPHRDIGNDIPQTREEALLTLGMGVAPDVNEAAIKKIVDGLRQSWHPDYAKSDTERQLRELRMKQINAAWAIISGKDGNANAGTGTIPLASLPPDAA
jgi:hypothetical protein